MLHNIFIDVNDDVEVDVSADIDDDGGSHVLNNVSERQLGQQKRDAIAQLIQEWMDIKIWVNIENCPSLTTLTTLLAVRVY